jgi:hypothetical protein
MKTKIHRRCACGCGAITNLGKKVIHGHNQPWKGKHHSKRTKQKISLTKEGVNLSKEHKLKIGLGNLRQHPDDKYCEAWRDKEYKDDLRKDYCENVDCKGHCKELHNHHINLNKKNCRPFNVMTLCNTCHISLHSKLEYIINKRIIFNHKDYLTIIRKDRIAYIHKGTRNKIILERRS